MSRTETGKRRARERKLAYENGELVPQEDKWCKMCDEVKPYTEYYIRFDYDGLLSHYCRKCHMSDNKMYKRRRRNKKKMRAVILTLKPIFCYEINSLRMDRHMETECG
jgi:hypothetical protein